MLVLSRKPGESILIDLMEHIDPRTPVGALFAHGPIEVAVVSIQGLQVKVGIDANTGFRILRDELSGEGQPRKFASGNR